MITLKVTLEPAQRKAVMAAIHDQHPTTTGTVQAITDRGLFCIRPLGRSQLPEALTAEAVRNIALSVLSAEDATARLGTFSTSRPYDRSGHRTLKPYHKSR
jgi:hypothetical protein